MKTRLTFLLFLSQILGWAQSLKPLVAPGTLMLKVSSQQSANALVQKVKLQIPVAILKRAFPKHSSPLSLTGNQVDLSLIFEIKSLSASNKIILKNWAKDPKMGIVYAVDRYYHRTAFQPSDAFLGSQYHLPLTGFFQAWDSTQGDTSIIIGIVDSGTDLDHPDLATNLARNPADVPDGIDNDNNGIIDDYLGVDLAGATHSNPEPDGNPDITGQNNFHGVHVAGITAAVFDNGQGVAGAGGRCRYLPIKCAADDDRRAGGLGFILTGYEGIVYAADRGAKVINCSWGGYGYSPFEQDIINYATNNRGALIVAAAGNDNTTGQFYPASYQHVLSVAATDQNDARAGFSNYNYDVDLAAPGVGIFSTMWNDTYTSISGTSMAAPLVAGAAALLISRFPAYSPAQIEALLKTSADNINSLPANSSPRFQGRLGAGRLNIGQAFRLRLPYVLASRFSFTDNNNQIPTADEGISITATFTNLLAPLASALTAYITTDELDVIIDPDSSFFLLNSLGTLDSIRNTATPFRFRYTNALAFNREIVFKLTIEGGIYHTEQYFSVLVNPSFIDWSTPYISSTSTAEGRVGFTTFSQRRGQGFRYRGSPSLFYEAGLMVSCGNKISNCIRSIVASASNDFLTRKPALSLLHPQASIFTQSAYTDSLSPQPLSLYIKEFTLAYSTPADSNYFIKKLVLTNRGTSALSNLRIGYFADFDLSEGGSQDVTVFDSIYNLAYTTNNANLVAGIAILSQSNFFGYYPIINADTGRSRIGIHDGFTREEKIATLQPGLRVPLPSSGDDVSQVISTGIALLAPGDSAEINVAFVAGATLQALQQGINQANSRVLTTTAQPVSEQALRVYPNPTHDFVQWVPELPGVQNVKFTSITGQLVSHTTIPVNAPSQFSLSSIPQGTYLLSVNNKFSRVVKQ